jgi:Tetratricopeptide repeat
MIYMVECGSLHRFQPRGDTRRDNPGDDSKEKDKNMNRLARLPVLAALLVAMMASLTGCNQLRARMELNKGVAAFKAGKPEQAITHFQDAVKYDPSLPQAKSYLATALAQNVVPGLTTKENMKTAQQAIDTFQQVLAEHPDDVNSLKGVGSLYFNMKKLSEAKEWQKKVLAVDPKDAEAAYFVGVIDWTQAHENLLKILTPVGANDDGNGNAKVLTKGLCTQIQEQNGALVEEGLKYLNMAVENRPSYDDAMSYLNLTYRKKADVDCGNEDARKDDVAKATDWNSKAMGTRKENEAKKDKSGGGIVMDSNGQMK